MHGFARSAVLLAALACSLGGGSSNAIADEMQTTIRVSLTILPTLNTRLTARALPDGRTGFDNGFETLDLAAVDFSVRVNGVNRRFVDASSALYAIDAEKKRSGDPAVITLVF